MQVAGPTQTHAGCGLTPYDFLAHVDHVLFEDYFFVFRSILQRCDYKVLNVGKILSPIDFLQINVFLMILQFIKCTNAAIRSVALSGTLWCSREDKL